MESTDQWLFHDPFAGREYESVVHLWAAYVRGYLNAEMRTASDITPAFRLDKREP